MRIGILTTGSDKSADDRLCEAAEARGHKPVLIDVLSCSLTLSETDSHIYHHGVPVENSVDVIIPRIDIPHTEFGLAVLRQFQALNIPTTDFAASIQVGRDKLICLQYLVRENIPMPATGFAYTRDDFIQILESVGGAPLVVKLLEGTQGEGVYLAKDKEEALSIFDTHNTTGMRTILQEFIEESSGTDIRSFVVGNEIVANMRRVAQTDDFRANVALGAHSFDEPIPPEEEALVLKAVQAIGINIAGVDFIRSKRGPLIIEINTSPGFTGEQGLESVTNVDVAGHIVDFATATVLMNSTNNWYNVPLVPNDALSAA